MLFEYLKLNIVVSDEEFNVIYPEPIRKLAKVHWTPVAVAKQAAKFLVGKPGVKVLDIGSGAGKFCMVGATFTNGLFTGIEQREHLYLISVQIKRCYNLPNIKFVHSNITQIEFREFNSFYLFNPFYENINQIDRIDDSVEIGIDLYNYYLKYVFEQLNQMPVGTRLATYWCDLEYIPFSFKIVASKFDGLLKMWEKAV